LNYRRSKHGPRQPTQDKAWQGPLPRVLLQLPIFNERYVVERLLEAVAGLDYPAGLLTIQVLDDSTDDTSQIASGKIAELQKGGVRIQHIRRKDRTGFKPELCRQGLVSTIASSLPFLMLTSFRSPRF
jgi:cellulose synthase/poly-beta-1,6-N-acetylglucosamine synthase-like glycosyltransferase